MTPSGGRVRLGLLLRLSWLGFARSGSRSWSTVLIGTGGALVLLVGVMVYPIAQAQADRTTRLLPLPTSVKAGTGHLGLLMETRKDHYRERGVRATTVAAAGATPLRPPGVSTLPAPGQLVVSPALAQLLHNDSMLRQRYPGTVEGLVGPEGLIGPKDLVLYQGATVAEMTRRGARLTLAFDSPQGANPLPVPSEVKAGVPFTVIAFLLPILALFSVVTTMGSAARGRRVAALRLLGLTSRQVRATIAGEAVVSTAAAFLVALALVVLFGRPLAAHAPVGDGIWPQDVTLPAVPVLVAGLVLPVLAGLTTWFSLRRAAAHPLEAARDATTHGAHPRRLLLLGAGVLVMLTAEPARLLFGTGPSTATLAIGCAMTMAGLITGTGVLNLLTARRVVTVTGRLSSLIAGRRLGTHPTQSAKIATGVSLLVFVSGLLLSFFPLLSASGASDARALTALVGRDTFLASVRTQGDLARLRSTPGAGPVAEFHAVGSASGATTTYLDCAGAAQLLHITEPDCLDGLSPRTSHVLQGTQVIPYASRVLPTRAVPQQVWRPSVDTQHVVLVRPAPGADPERVRSAVIAVATDPQVSSVGEIQADLEKSTKTFRDITITALVLAGLVAAASLTAALVDQIQLQRRSYAMLKVTGVPHRALLSALAQLTVLTIAPTAALAWGLGLLASAVFLRLNDTSRLPLPAASSAWVLLAALLIPLAACLAVSRTLRTSLTSRLD